MNTRNTMNTTFLRSATMLVISMCSVCSFADETAQDAGDSGVVTNSLIQVTVRDDRGRDWDGGYYTQLPKVSVTFADASRGIVKVSASVMRCDGILRADGTYKFIEDALESESPDLDIEALGSGDSVDFDVAIPGRYSLAWCAYNESGELMEKHQISFDSLNDDGQWISCGNATLSSGALSNKNEPCHLFQSAVYNLWVMWNCPVDYPYYSGETWTAPVEYNETLEMYRIVNPFTVNQQFKDYLPADEELLSYTDETLIFHPEAFIFDREHPSWFLLNAQDGHDAYCEPMRTGIVAMHSESPCCYTAHRYNEKIGYVIYDVSPVQDIIQTGSYTDMPLDDENESTLKVQFDGWASVGEITGADASGAEEYYTLDGMKVARPSRGNIYIAHRNGLHAKIRY